MAVLSDVSARSIRKVALPTEHGGWAFLMEPILLGLLLAPSISGFFLSVSGLGLFLLYQPTQLVFKDRLKDKRYPRTIWAERFMVLYTALVVGSGLLAFFTTRFPFWLALLLAAPCAGLQMLLVLRGRSRTAISEMSGALALGALTSAIVLANGAVIPYALALWLVPACRAFTSILYIRARLRRSHGEVIDTAVPLMAQIAGIAVLGMAWLAKLLPITAPLAMLVLASRAVYGLYWARRDIPAKQIGFQEIGFGLFMVLLVVIGH